MSALWRGEAGEPRYVRRGQHLDDITAASLVARWLRTNLQTLERFEVDPIPTADGQRYLRAVLRMPLTEEEWRRYCRAVDSA